MTKALTTSTALKQKIETFGLGAMAYRDAAPEDAEMPYIVVHEAIDTIPIRGGDAGANDSIEEGVQIDYWQVWIDRSGDVPVLGEDPAKVDALVAALHGCSLDASPTKSYGVRVDNRTRQLDRQANTVRNIIDATVRRNLK